jgi:hypothetical protein
MPGQRRPYGHNTDQSNPPEDLVGYREDLVVPDPGVPEEALFVWG